MIEPGFGFRQRQFVEGNAFEDCGTGTPDTLWIWKFSGQTPSEQIQHPLLFLAEFLLFRQNAPALD